MRLPTGSAGDCRPERRACQHVGDGVGRHARRIHQRWCPGTHQLFEDGFVFLNLGIQHSHRLASARSANLADAVVETGAPGRNQFGDQRMLREGERPDHDQPRCMQITILHTSGLVGQRRADL